MSNDLKVAELERLQRERVIAGGKNRFVLREFLFSTSVIAIVMTVLYLSGGGTRSALLAGAVVGPISVVAGYLRAIWKWQDIQKGDRL
jgi:hypothetical protein